MVNLTVRLNPSIDVLTLGGRSMSRPCLFLTNDDGIEAPGLHVLIQGLLARGFPIVVMAPAREQSASGMRISLRHDLKFVERTDLAADLGSSDGPPLRMFSLDGTPCDCAIVALDGGLAHWAPEMKPALCISGVNQGPNLSVDVMHSGTVSAAREAGLYGLPALATSLSTYQHSDFEQSVEATIEVIEAAVRILPKEATNLLRPNGSRTRPKGADERELIIDSFCNGDLMLNINAPETWTNGFRTVSLGVRWYHNAIDMSNTEHLGVAYEVGAARIEDEDIPDTDCNAVNDGAVAITPLSCWPVNHPLGISQRLLAAATQPGTNGFPFWLEE